jgi:hypothetical protein
MKIISILLFIFTSFIGPVNPLFNNSIGMNNLFLIDNVGFNQSLSELSKADRYYEEEGGFSYIPPDGWTIKEVPGNKYKFVFGPLTGNYSPNINFIPEDYSGSIDRYVDDSLKSLNQIFKDAKIISKTTFITDSGNSGFKIIIDNKFNDLLLQQTLFLIDGGNKKFAITYSRLRDKGKEFDSKVDMTARSFQYDQGCTNPLSGSSFEKSISRVSITLADGWKPVSGLPTNDRIMYVKNSDKAHIMLMVFAYETNTSLGKCLEESGKILQEASDKKNVFMGRFNFLPKEIIIDGNNAIYGVADGYLDTKKTNPFEYVLLGISNQGTVFEFHFIASGENPNQAQSAIDSLPDAFGEIVKTIKID